MFPQGEVQIYFDMNLFLKLTEESKLNLTITRDRLWAPMNIPIFDKLGR